MKLLAHLLRRVADWLDPPLEPAHVVLRRLGWPSPPRRNPYPEDEYNP